MVESYHSDIETIISNIKEIETEWDGKKCILEMKEVDFQWRQTEWWGFYFEYASKILLNDVVSFPGDKYENTVFDLKGKINWDLKASDIENENVILNDINAMRKSVVEHGYHGEIIGLFEVEKDIDGKFKQWHSILKGNKSKYPTKKTSRLRKTKVSLKKILFVIIDKSNINKLKIMKQGKNSNGKYRKEKYMLNMKTLHNYQFCSINMEAKN